MRIRNENLYNKSRPIPVSIRIVRIIQLISNKYLWLQRFEGLIKFVKNETKDKKISLRKRRYNCKFITNKMNLAKITVRIDNHSGKKVFGEKVCREITIHRSGFGNKTLFLFQQVRLYLKMRRLFIISLLCFGQIITLPRDENIAAVVRFSNSLVPPLFQVKHNFQTFSTSWGYILYEQTHDSQFYR